MITISACSSRLVRIPVLAILLGLSVFANGTDFYVAPTGSDSNPGSKSKPFASLERAREAVRAARLGDKQKRGGITVWLRGGVYSRTNAFELTVADSGMAAAPVTYRAYSQERVTLSGGRAIDSFKPVTDPAVLSRLSEEARGRVLVADLRALGIKDFGEMKSRGFGRPITPAHCELFFNGKPMTLARWPNEGKFEQLAGFPATSGKGDDHGGNIGDLPSGFLYAGDRPRRWQDTSDLWVHGYWAWDWANSYERVIALDHDKKLIRTAAPHGLYGFRKGQRFYYLNVLEELDSPGEWFLDRGKGLLYFWPPAPRAPGKTLISLLDQPLLKLSDVSFVTFRGLALEATRANAVEIRGGTGDRIAGCNIRMIGDYGVVIEGGTNHGVVGCDLIDTGDGGVSITGGDRQTLTPGSHLVENCHFQRQGRWSKCYVPAVLLSGVGHRVAHNVIEDHPHCAILYTGNDHILEFNEIHHVALETGDVGAIYTGRDWTYRGTKIRHNYIHETGGVGMGSMGVYMDDCVSGGLIFGNIFYKVQRAAFLGGGRDHRVENNIFVDCNPAVQLDGRGMDKSPVWHDMVYDFMKKQLAAVPAGLYRQRYPEIATLDRYYATNDGVPPENNLVARNICVGKWTEVHWHAKSESLELRDNLVDQNPKFISAQPADLRLAKDSPAWALGFQAIPVDKIGLRKDEFRGDLARWEKGGEHGK